MAGAARPRHKTPARPVTDKHRHDRPLIRITPSRHRPPRYSRPRMPGSFGSGFSQSASSLSQFCDHGRP